MKQLSRMFPPFVGACLFTFVGCNGSDTTGLNRQGVQEGEGGETPNEVPPGDEAACNDLQAALEACFEEAQQNCEPEDFECVSACFPLKEEFARLCIGEGPHRPKPPLGEIGACEALHVALEACFQDGGCEARCQIIHEAIVHVCESPDLCCTGHDRKPGDEEGGVGEMGEKPYPPTPGADEPEPPVEGGP